MVSDCSTARDPRAASRRGFAACGLALALAAAAYVSAPPAAAQTAIGVGGVLFFDDGDLDDDERVGPRRDRSSEEGGSDGVLGGELSFLYALSPHPREGFRVGGDLRFLGDYGVTDDDGEVYGLGALFELAARAEWSVDLIERLALTLGLRLGLATLFPGDDLEDTLDDLAAQGADVAAGPRLGFVISPLLGARYQLLDRLLARLDLRLSWQKLFLVDIDQPVQGIAYERSLSWSVLRFEIVFGLEVAL